MFFWASKIFWILFKPLTLIGLMMVAGLIIRHWLPRLGRLLLGLAIALFLAIGFLPIGPTMLGWLETRYAQPALPPDVDGIIVLGGVFDTYLSAQTKQIVANDNMERMIAFVDLARRYSDAKLVFSGGAGNINAPGRSESLDARAYLETISFPAERVTFEERSRTTYENAILAKLAAKPQEHEIWVLITSASHMPRAVSVFRKAGWEVIPYPVDPGTPLERGRLADPLDVSANFRAFEEALKEIIGQIVYGITGKSDWPS